jgi:hypothetical protein
MSGAALLRSATVRAQAKHVNDVTGLREPMFRGDLRSPALHRIGFDLHREPAVAADQVVVVAARGAGAIQALALLLERIRISLDREVGQRAVDRCQPDGRARVAKSGVETLCADEALRSAQSLSDGFSLPGIALHP